MTITRVCYANRDDAARSLDFKPGVDVNAALDRGLRSSTENIEAHLHRKFYPYDATLFWDWPNQGGSGGGQYASPWRLWFDQYDCVVLTALASGGLAIPLNAVFLEPVNRRPDWPATYLELDRSQSVAFGGNAQTPQHSISGTGTWGFTAAADSVATLASNVGQNDTAITVSNGASVGAGDLVILGYGQGTAPYPAAAGYAGALAPVTGERILVTDKTAVAAGLTLSGAGCTSEVNSDNQLSVTGAGTAPQQGETVQVDGEQMLVESVAGGVATVIRAWNATTITTHSTGAAVYAYRSLSVNRAILGTAYQASDPAAYESGAAVYRHRPPGLVRDLCLAEAVNRVLQEGSGYSRTVGGGEAQMPASGLALADLWDEARTAFGRKARHRAI